LLTTSLLRKNNMLEILKVIKQKRVMTRPEIAHLTKLTTVTVSTLVGELIRKNIVVEEGFANSIGGRKPALYRFNNDAYHIIGVNIKMNTISVDLFDLGANKVFAGNLVHFKTDQSVETTITAMERSILDLVGDTKDKYPNLIGIGITLPGRVDYANGVVCHLTNLKNWVNIPLRSIIEKATGIRTYIERDTNSHISYLKWLDITEGRCNVLYCTIGEGIGAAVLIDGGVYHGEHGLAGEVGHTSLNPDGPRCNCGNYGCVEMYTSNRAILDVYLEASKAHGGPAPEMTEHLGDAADEADAVDALAARAMQGDEAAREAFVTASKYICALLSNIINTYNPSMIILECRWMRVARPYFSEVVTEVFEKTTLLDRNDMKIILNPVEDIFSMASSTVVLEQLFSDVDDNKLIG
jgi:N-acetylglucosamine repressor